MLKLQKVIAVLAAASVGAAVWFVLTGIFNTPAEAVGKPNVGSALPTPEELPEFAGFGHETSSEGHIVASSVTAYRKVDKARLEVVAVVTGSEEDAHEWVQQRAVLFQSTGPFAKGSPSGQPIGQECWNSQRNQGPPQTPLQIIARDGRAIVSVTLNTVPKRDKKGNPILHAALSPTDVRKVEHEAIKALSKLARAGYTSKSK